MSAFDSSQPQQVCLNAHELTIAYDSFVALSIAEMQLEGSVIAVIGHNGAGKSTLIKGLLGLLPPQKGSLTASVGSPETRTILQADIHMAFCPEVGSVFADISVESYMKMWCRVKHRDASYYKKAGSVIIERMQIPPLLKKLGRELSKGQRRQVQTAIGFLQRPKLFLFDEPFDGLDVQKTSDLADIMRSESRNMAFIISSHRMDVVERLADKLIVLKNGQVVTFGNLEYVCQNLCERTILITSSSHSQEVFSALTDVFPDVLVNHIGQQLFLTGRDISDQKLNQVLENLQGKVSRAEEVKPSLVDAMNYHLREQNK